MFKQEVVRGFVGKGSRHIVVSTGYVRKSYYATICGIKTSTYIVSKINCLHGMHMESCKDVMISEAPSTQFFVNQCKPPTTWHQHSL